MDSREGNVYKDMYDVFFFWLEISTFKYMYILDMFNTMEVNLPHRVDLYISISSYTLNFA